MEPEVEVNEPEVSGGEEVQAPALTIDFVRQRIPQAVRSLNPILKRARTTETQRIIKKLKFLRKKRDEQKDEAGGSEGGNKDQAKEIAELEAQLECLKHLDLHAIAPPLLLLKVRKHALTRPLLPLPDDLIPSDSSASVSSPVTPVASTSASSALRTKVENRLFSAKEASEDIARVVGWTVGQEGMKLVQHGVKVKAETKASRLDATTARSRKSAAQAQAQGQPQASVSSASREAMHPDRLKGLADLEEDAMADEAGWESGSVSGSDDDEDEGEEAGSGESDNDSGAESSSEAASKDRKQDPAKVQPGKQKRTASQSPPPAKRAKTNDTPASQREKASSAVKPPKNIKSSVFLPSLSVGYTAGDISDDDFDPDEDERRANKKAGLNANGERKNRRGQRERRAIWEKKYGRGANHLKKEQEAGKAAEQAEKFRGKGAKPDSGWGDRGATASAGAAATSRVTRYRQHNKAQREEAAAGGNPATSYSSVIAPPSTAGSGLTAPPAAAAGKAGPEHPSWQAARLRKQKEMAVASALGGGAAAPKKIVFD